MPLSKTSRKSHLDIVMYIQELIEIAKIQVNLYLLLSNNQIVSFISKYH